MDVGLLVVVGGPPSGASNNDVITGVPVWFSLDFNNSVAWGGSFGKSGPNGGLWNTVHAEFAVSAANHLVSVD